MNRMRMTERLKSRSDRSDVGLLNPEPESHFGQLVLGCMTKLMR
jgi:hypothetical protein